MQLLTLLINIRELIAITLSTSVTVEAKDACSRQYLQVTALDVYGHARWHVLSAYVQRLLRHLHRAPAPINVTVPSAQTQPAVGGTAQLPKWASRLRCDKHKSLASSSCRCQGELNTVKESKGKAPSKILAAADGDLLVDYHSVQQALCLCWALQCGPEHLRSSARCLLCRAMELILATHIYFLTTRAPPGYHCPRVAQAVERTPTSHPEASRQCKPT
ncbi:hypothetical protein H920_13163 [Fukomys damarensis]|uniref:Secreted protein n=1 Tax=Fukomys damarensis TaxID=885580 RepID=A0A091D314_FUKDA|nr:hypothetical protein H920_13163 [Fukomys damarensis]